MKRSRLRVLAASAAVAAALVVGTPATVASAQPCQGESCHHGTFETVYKLGWILYADADGTGSYWVVAPYERDAKGHCFDVHHVGVGCPD